MKCKRVLQPGNTDNEYIQIDTTAAGERAERVERKIRTTKERFRSGHGDTYDENWRCDWLSRHRTREEVLAEDLKDARGSQLTEVMETWDVDETELLTLCHPVWNVLDTEEQFGTWRGKLLALLTTNRTIIPDEPQVGDH